MLYMTGRDMEIDLDYPIVFFSEEQEPETESIELLFSTECEHMPDGNYSQRYKTRELQASDRQEAISLILKISRLDPFIAYLAVNYHDRFISRQDIPRHKAWIFCLVCVSCVSLASKMRKSEFSLSDLQKDEGFFFDVQTIRRMELLILSALKWRMRSVTPFSFINFFLSLCDIDFQPLKAVMRARAIEIVLRSQAEVKILEFRPSLVAAASVLCASREIGPSFFSVHQDSVSECVHMNKDQLATCCELMQDMIVVDKYEPAARSMSSDDTPVTVLDRHRSSSESEHGDGAVAGSTTSSSGGLATVQLYQTVASTKRQRLNGLCSSKIVQVSQMQHCPT